MGEITPHGAKGDMPPVSGYTTFDGITAFTKAVEAVVGEDFDIESVTQLDTDFVQATDRYLLLNVREYGSRQPNHLLFLNADKVYTFSNKNPSLEEIKTFEDVLEKPYGRGTVITYFILDKVLDSHKQLLESFIRKVKQLEDNFDHVEYRNLTLEFERLSDRVEEFDDLLLRLQERHYRQVETQLIAFDYRILLAESTSLQGRCRRRLYNLRELRQDHETRATEELNGRIVKLNDVVKRLTALTVLLMLPTLIASHFGMNFVFMPELKIQWVYPAVILLQFAIVGVGFWVFKKIDWL